MLPLGYEYGFRNKPDVVSTTPEDWEEPQYDLTEFVGAVNRMKAECPPLNEEGPQEMVAGWETPVTVLIRHSERGGGLAVALINHDPWSGHSFPAGELARAARTYGLTEVTPETAHEPLRGEVHLNPREMRVFFARG